MIASKTDGAIVRSLDDKTKQIYLQPPTQFSHLESIEVYTQHENVNLIDIFKSMDANSEQLPL